MYFKLQQKGGGSFVPLGHGHKKKKKKNLFGGHHVRLKDDCTCVYYMFLID